MTIFYLDVAQYEGKGSDGSAGLSVKAVQDQGFAGIMARCSVGKTADTEFSRFRSEARALGFPFAAYHFLKSESHTPVDVQAKACADALGDKSIPVMLDVESDNNSVPSVADMVRFSTYAAGEEVHVRCQYLPHWYWDEIGQPVLPGLPLVASAYPLNYTPGHATELYRGDKEWPADYGMRSPFAWQFSSSCIIDGFVDAKGHPRLVDVNAYRGTIQDLVHLGIFTDWGNTTMTAPGPKGYLASDGSGRHWVIAFDLSSRVEVTDGAFQGMVKTGFYTGNPGIDQTTLVRIPDVTVRPAPNLT